MQKRLISKDLQFIVISFLTLDVVFNLIIETTSYIVFAPNMQIRIRENALSCERHCILGETRWGCMQLSGKLRINQYYCQNYYVKESRTENENGEGKMREGKIER